MADQAKDESSKLDVTTGTRSNDYVSMKREDYKRIKDNFTLMKAKFLKSQEQNKSLQNLYAVLSAKDDELKTFKARAHKCENDYMNVKAQLSRLARKVIDQKGGKDVDLSGILEIIALPSPEGHITIGEIPEMVEKEKNVQDENGADKINSSNGDEPNGDKEVSAIDTSMFDSRMIQRLIHENDSLKNKINKFEKNEKAWANFKDNDENKQLIDELRRELVRSQVTCSELKVLLDAKRNDNIDALTKQLNTYMNKVPKLEQQLRSKQELLEAVTREYQQLKKEQEIRRKLRTEQPRPTDHHRDSGMHGASGGDEMHHGNDDDDDDNLKHKSMSGEESFDPGYISCDIETTVKQLAALQQEKEEMAEKMKAMDAVQREELESKTREIQHLEQKQSHLEEEAEELKIMLKDGAQANPASRDDQPITRLVLQEENEKLRERVNLFEHEHKKLTSQCSIQEAQMSNLEAELRKKSTQDLRFEQQRNEKLSTQLQDAKSEIEQLTQQVQQKSNEIARLHKELSEAQTTIRDMPRFSPATPTFSPYQQHTNLNQAPGYYPRSTVACDSLPEPEIRPAAILRNFDSLSATSPNQQRIYPGGESARALSAGPQLYGAGPQQRTDASLSRSEVTESISFAQTDQDKPFVCERCLREFRSHEEHKYKQHIRKCQD